MMIGLLAALTLQALPAPTAPGWQRVGGDERGEFAVHSESVRRSGDEVTAMVRIEVNRGERTGQRVLGVIRYVYNCRANTQRIEASELYDAAGRSVGSAPLPPERSGNRPIAPGTPSAAVRDHLCGRQGQ